MDRLQKALAALVEAADGAAWSANVGTMDAAIEEARAALEAVKPPPLIPCAPHEHFPEEVMLGYASKLGRAGVNFWASTANDRARHDWPALRARRIDRQHRLAARLAVLLEADPECQRILAEEGKDRFG
jgi:hypothetical protein